MQVDVVHLENFQLGFFFNLVTCLMTQACELAPSLSVTFFLAFVMTYILHCLSLSYKLQILEFQTLIISLAFAPHHLSFYFEACFCEAMHVGKDFQKCNIPCVLSFVPFHKLINSKPLTIRFSLLL